VGAAARERMIASGSSFRTGTPPRRLTAELRRELDLPIVRRVPYRWTFACVVVATACVPLLLAKLWTLTVLAVLLGLVVVPAVRWFEHREAAWREDVYRTGMEARGRVLDVEPAGSQRKDHLVRVEFLAGDAMVRASVIGCPLARKGLAPDDNVVILFAADRPARCLIVGRLLTEIVDAVFED
jgi:hypothetical protein